MDKKEQIERLEEFILKELDSFTTPLEAMVETNQEKIERANVLYNVYKILENYDTLEPILKEYFAKDRKTDELER